MNGENIIKLNNVMKKLLLFKIKSLQKNEIGFIKNFYRFTYDLHIHFLKIIALNTKLLDKAIEDVVDMIIVEGNFNNLNEFIDDVNRCNHLTIKDKLSLVLYIKNNFSISFFEGPIGCLLPSWMRTQKGVVFYYKLEKSMIREISKLYDCKKNAYRLLCYYGKN